MKGQTRWTAGATGLALLLVACDVRVGDDGLSLGIAEGRASEEWRGSYDLAAGDQLDVAGVNGTIQATAADGGPVEVLARIRVRARSDEAARALLDAVTIREEVSPGRVSLRMEREDGGSFRDGPGPYVEYEVRLPPGVGASLSTENGEVRLEGLDGRLQVSTTNGRIIGRDLAGGIEARTVNGGIEVDFARVAGDVRMRTVNGGIRVTVGADARATIEASAVNGGASVDDALPFEAGTRDRKGLTGRLNGGGPLILLETVNGAVRVAGRD